MPSLSCVVCDGEGMAFVVYCNHGTRTLHKRMIPCPRCNKSGSLEAEKKEGEEVLEVAVDIQNLLNYGYKYVQYK